MINSFRRMRTGKRTGDGEADGGRGSGRGTGKRTEAAAAVRAVRLFGRRRLSSPAWPAASGAKPPPQQEPAAAELNFEMLIVVNNKFVDELAFVVFVFKNLGGTV